MDPKLFFSDPDPTFQAISDPDPTWFPIKEEKANILKEKCSNSFNIKEEICEAFFYSKIDKTWVLSRFHTILVTKNWSLSDPDPKLIIANPYPDPDPANNFGSDRIRIHNTAWKVQDRIIIHLLTQKSDPELYVILDPH